MKGHFWVADSFLTSKTRNWTRQELPITLQTPPGQDGSYLSPKVTPADKVRKKTRKMNINRRIATPLAQMSQATWKQAGSPQGPSSSWLPF
jgi:hypothetical protein